MLAQADTGEINYFHFFLGMVALVVCVLILWVAVNVVRKKLKEDDATVGTGFTLSDLRQLHKQGKMSAEEYEKAKAILLANIGKATEPAPKPKPDET